MASRSEEFQRSCGYAEIALGQMKALGQPPHPRNYAIWYTYATGQNPELNEAINRSLPASGKPSDSSFDRSFDSYLQDEVLAEGIDEVGGKIAHEIDQVMFMIDNAAGSTTQYTESLAEAARSLSGAKDSDGLRKIIETLVRATRQMENNNSQLEESLRASKQEVHQLQSNLEAVRSESLTDPLTSLANRKSFDQALDRMISESTAKGEHLALLMADIDHFKAFNDTFGHLTGDQVLRLVGKSIKQNLREEDIAARYGGEEFAIIVPGARIQAAFAAAERIRRAVMKKELVKQSTSEHLGRVTISMGVAVLRRGDSAQSLIERADDCLYSAKRAGRNRAICENAPSGAVPARVA